VSARAAVAADTGSHLDWHWRARLVRKLGWVFALKLLALTLIWLLWFAPGRIAPVDASSTGAHLGFARGQPAALDARTAVDKEIPGD
jgi:hypothetical protein